MRLNPHLIMMGQGPPLVLVHGWGWDASIWQTLVPELSKYYQLLMIDLPGAGQNITELSAYTLDEIAQTIFSGLPNKATWLGWSLGGLLAWWIAIHYPKKITQLITVASSPCFLQDENWPGIKKNTLTTFSESLLKNREACLTEFLTLQLRGHPNKETLFSLLKNNMLTANQSGTKALLGGLQLLCETDLRSQLNQIQCPSLHIFGSHDTIVPVTVTEFLQPLVPAGKCEIIKRAGHIPFLSQQQDFLNLLKINTF